MNEHDKYAFFCIESDYPKFVTLFPDEFPHPYKNFVTMVRQRIENAEEQFTVERTEIGYADFIAECYRCGEKPNYQRLRNFTTHVGSKKKGFRISY